MSIKFVTTYLVRIITENMFGEVIELWETIKIYDEDLNEVIEERFAPLSYTIEAQRTESEPVF